MRTCSQALGRLDCALIKLGLVFTLLLAVQHLGTWGSSIVHLQAQ
jgi:hypothetical protein